VVGRTVARVSAEEHMANYQAARALMVKENSAVTRVKERPGLQRIRERGSSAKKGAKEVRGEEGETKEVTLGRTSKTSYLRRHR
jgi:hypothetical protein